MRKDYLDYYSLQEANWIGYILRRNYLLHNIHQRKTERDPQVLDKNPVDK